MSDQISRLIEAFVFNTHAKPSKELQALAGGEDESISYMTGLLLGCNHEFRIGPNANYKAHLTCLPDPVFFKVYAAFGVARPKDPFLSVGSFVKLSPIKIIFESIPEMENGSKTICVSFWKINSNPKENVAKFYRVWFENVRRHLEETNRYHHESFLAGLLHRLPSEDYAAEDLLKEIETKVGSKEPVFEE